VKKQTAQLLSRCITCAGTPERGIPGFYGIANPFAYIKAVKYPNKHIVKLYKN